MMRPLVLIVIAELFGTSLWFCGAMAAPELGRLWELSPTARGGLLTAVQLGFIAGTLLLSLSGLADRFPAHRIFALGCFAGAASNAALLLCESLPTALLCRFAVGLCLAGIYPLGMKLVIAWAPTSAGTALGWLIGALVIGSSTPYLLRGLTDAIDWQWAVGGASVLAVIGGVMIATLGSGHVADGGGRLGLGKVLAAFRVPAFRRSAFAYFGHMWEVYAFWALIPFYIEMIWHEADNAFANRATFAVMGIGAFGCVFGGWWSRRIGSERVATFALAASGAMCAASPFLPLLPASVAFALLLFWSIAAASDSPQFSAISARACPPGTVGSALAVQNGIGFLLSVFAIHLVADMRPTLESHIGWLLLPGPLLGLIAWNRRRSCQPAAQVLKLR